MSQEQDAEIQSEKRFLRRMAEAHTKLFQAREIVRALCPGESDTLEKIDDAKDEVNRYMQEVEAALANIEKERRLEED